MDWMRKESRKNRADLNAVRGGRGAYYNFTDALSLFSDAAGATPIADATGIYVARDLSGNNNDVSQATSGSRPTWSVNGYATFDGTSDHLFKSGGIRFTEGGQIAERWTVMAQVNSSPATSAYLCSMGLLSGATSVAWGCGSDTVTASTMTSFIRNDAGTLSHPQSTDLQTNVFNGATNIIALTCGGLETAPQFTPFLNGVRGARVNGASYDGNHTVDLFTIGALKRNTVSGWMAMNLYHLLIVDRVMDQSEIIAIGLEWRKQARL